MNSIITIDPGKSGGIAVWDARDEQIFLFPMPDTEGDVCTMLCGIPTNSRCYMELVGGYIAGAKLPGSAMFNFGMGYGYIKGVLAARGISLELVRPQKWQKDLSIGEKDKSERKRRLKEKAQQLYPSVDGITLKTCDALLLLHWAIEKKG